MASQGPYDVGMPVRIAFSFADPVTGAPVDPTTITFKYVPPGQARVTISTPDARIVRDGAGSYHVVVDTTGWVNSGASGPQAIRYRIEPSGNYVGAIDGQFMLNPSPLWP